MTSTPTFFDAVLFDLDGVLTATAALHAAAWKETFDSVLDEPFDIERDYLAHVDGKPRLDGVRDLLRSRGIEAGEPAVRAIAARKQALVEHLLADNGVDAFPGSVRWIEQLRARAVRTAVVSSGTNSRAVLSAAGIDGLFDLTLRRARRRAAGAARQARPRRLPRRGRAARRRAGARDRRRGRARRRRRRARRRVRARDRRRARRRPGRAARRRRRRRRRRPWGAGLRCATGAPARPSCANVWRPTRQRRGGSPRRGSRPTGSGRSSRCSPSATATSACAARPTRERR